MIATYGHGTENDFVLVFDPKDEQSITTAQTAAICNRESGIGADGLIRIIKRDEARFTIEKKKREEERIERLAKEKIERENEERLARIEAEKRQREEDDEEEKLEMERAELE